MALQYFATINTNTGKICDTDNNYAKIAVDKRMIAAAAGELIFCASLVDQGGNAIAIGASDTFYMAGDANFNKYEDAGASTGALTGTASQVSIKSASLSGTIPENGKITLLNGSLETEIVVYQSWEVSGSDTVFTLWKETALTYTYAEDDAFTVANGVMFYSDSALGNVDVAGDWDDIDRATGKISIALSFDNDLFDCRSYANKDSAGESSIFIEIGWTKTGGDTADKVLTDVAKAKQDVYREGGAAAAAAGGTVLTTTTGDARYAKLTGSSDIEITDDEKGLILTSPDSTRYRLTVSDEGYLNITEVV